MLTIYIIISIVAAAAVALLRRERVVLAIGWLFYAFQTAVAVGMLVDPFENVLADFFTIDSTGTLFFVLMAAISPMAFYASTIYLDRETRRQKGIYHALVIVLCMAVTCVYFSRNIAVTWIFLEATTLATAGLVYHRGNRRNLEATWKYIFVCSVGITMAYLGILLLAGMSQGGGLDYDSLSGTMNSGSPLFLKIAFLFILVGYSCKLEVFPLYNIGIDANFSTPSPASALISTVLVNAGFVSVFRVYKIMAGTEIYQWMSDVLIITGLVSLLVSAAFMRRTSQYKRLFSYSTVENMGIVLLCLGIGGSAVLAAVIHITGHTLIKSSMFFQIARVGKTFGHYRVNRTGNYMEIDQSSAVMLLLTTLLLLAFPPSPLFVSELIMFGEMAASGRWWLLIVTVLIICTVIYNLGRHILRLCFQPYEKSFRENIKSPGFTVMIALLTICSVLFGIWRPEWLMEWLNSIARL